MKLTKSALREIIREEIENLKGSTIRLTRLVNEGRVINEVDGTVKNPETGRTIKVKTALSYPPDHPAHKAAMKSQSGTSSTKSSSTSSMSINDKAWSMKKSKNRYGDVVFSMNDKAVDEMESILNKVTGKLGTAQMDDNTGVLQYYLPDNDDVNINIGPDEENGEYVVTMEDFYNHYTTFDTYKSFKTPKEAMAYAAKLASKISNTSTKTRSKLKNPKG